MNILLTSAGRRAYIVDYFKNCNGIGKVYAANSQYTIALKRADGYFLTPLIYDPNYIASIINFCKEKDIKAVLSLFDIDLLVLAKHEAEFVNNGIKLILAPAGFVEICNDKYRTFEFCKKLGLQTPKTYLHIEDVMSAVKEGELSYPIIMKPRWGMASMGIYKVENEEELIIFTKKCKRDIFDSYLKYESSMTPDEAIIYQEIMTGEEYGLDVINSFDGKEYIATYAKQKVTMRSGETDLGRTASGIPFEEYTKKIAAESKHKGILSVDCFKNEKGIFIIEMNCRISGHYPLAYLAGFNYPQLLVDWLNGKDRNQELLKFEEDLYIIKDLVPTILEKK
ncbi:MAG: ATP-grasp domain-containing protein [Treponema sp.]|nr:ATP-grasp domain-containing protein [Treponema sp.]